MNTDTLPCEYEHTEKAWGSFVVRQYLLDLLNLSKFKVC